jgi:hypothetical protein
MATVKGNASPSWVVDPLQPTPSDPAYRFTGERRLWMVPVLIGVAALVMSAVGWAVNPTQFYFSYLIGWTFCVSISLGALFFVTIQHLTKAYWSVVVRRIAEALAMSFPLLVVLSIPIWLGLHDLYHWTHHDLLDPESPEYDPVLAGKAPYLNIPFFLVRMGLYFGAWSFIAWTMYRSSMQQDVQSTPDTPAQQRRTSAWALPVLAITTQFFAFDILMSLDPHWFSTIFGVYFFGGAFWSFFATTIFTASLLRRNGMLEHTITPEHYQDLGKFMFGFTVFWTYIAFSQYMLIWYANLPEETVFYRHRLEHGWEVHTTALIFGHFILPFFLTIGRWAKRLLPWITFMAVFNLVMHWFDHHWLAMPVAMEALHQEHASISWISLTCFIGLAGVFYGAVLYRLSRHSLVPQHEPRLTKSLHFTNF